MDLHASVIAGEENATLSTWLSDLGDELPQLSVPIRAVKEMIALNLNGATRDELLDRLSAQWGARAKLVEKNLPMWRLRLKVALIETGAWHHPAFRY